MPAGELTRMSGTPKASTPGTAAVTIRAVQDDLPRVDRGSLALRVGHLVPGLAGREIENSLPEDVGQAARLGPGRDARKLLEVETVGELVQEHRHEVDVGSVVVVESVVPVDARQTPGQPDVAVEPGPDVVGARPDWGPGMTASKPRRLLARAVPYQVFGSRPGNGGMPPPPLSKTIWIVPAEPSTAEVAVQVSGSKLAWMKISTLLSSVEPQIPAACVNALRRCCAEGRAGIAADGSERRRIVEPLARAVHVDDRDRRGGGGGHARERGRSTPVRERRGRDQSSSSSWPTSPLSPLRSFSEPADA